MGSLEDGVEGLVREALGDGTIESLMRERIIKGFSEAIDDALRFGELRVAVKDKVREMMLPCIRDYDVSRYIVKLDELLSQVTEQTVMTDNKRLLENFRHLMVDHPEETIRLETLFDRYCRFVASRIDTDGRKVNLNDGQPEYVSIRSFAKIEMDEMPSLSRHFVYANLRFWTDEEDSEFSYVVHLARWKGDGKDGFEIRYDCNPSLKGISYMDDFEVILSGLTRAGSRLVWGEDSFSYDVVPDKEPEPTWS